MNQRGWAAEPFFLRVARGQRFCLFHPPQGTCRGAVLYVHPFAEELNRSRRMAALQARELAAAGFGVLLLDLHGCGDSSGDFGDARWDSWKEDLAAASHWLRERLGGPPLCLWGLRLGALLALDYARGAEHPIDSAVLWQPVLSGQAFLSQFLRLRVANDMLGGAQAKSGTSALRAQLAGGETLEVAGYELHPELAQAIDGIDMSALFPGAMPLHWFEIAGTAGRPLPPASETIIDRWRGEGTSIQVHQVTGQPFWATPESAECPALLTATTAALVEPCHAV